MNKVSFWLNKLKEAAISTTPIVTIVFVLFMVERFTLWPFGVGDDLRISDQDMLLFIICALMIIAGMTLFGAGTEESMTDIGKVIGGSLVKKKNFFFVIAMTFILGVLVTIAEPDLSVLSSQIGISEQIIVWTIGIGVGVFLVVGVIRVLFHLSLNTLFLAFYGLVFTILYLINPRYLPICFDSGGVTTGPVTVPFLLGFGMGLAASHGKGQSSEDTFGLTALCSIGPILSVVIIAFIMNAMGKPLPETFADPLASIDPNIWSSLGSHVVTSCKEVALSVVPIFIFFLIYNAIFIRLKAITILRIASGMVVTYLGLVCFLSAVAAGFMPIASKVGQSFGSDSVLAPWAIGLGATFGICGVFAEPAVHVLVKQIETISDGAIKKHTVLIVLALSIGVAVGLEIIRSYYEFDLMYYLIPGYITAFALSFAVPKIYTAMAFDSGGVASGPMTSTFVLPFCLGFAYKSGVDVYMYGFGLVAMVAMMPLIVLQAMGLQSQFKKRHAMAKAKRRIVEENDDQVIHFGEEEAIA